MSEAAVSRRPHARAGGSGARRFLRAARAPLSARPPDAALLRARLRGAPPLAPSAVRGGRRRSRGVALAVAWNALTSGERERWTPMPRGTSTRRSSSASAAARVSLYASHYVGPQSGRPLAGDPRRRSPSWDSARRPATSEFEDHLALVLETMRMLVAGDAERPPGRHSAQRSVLRSSRHAMGTRNAAVQ